MLQAPLFLESDLLTSGNWFIPLIGLAAAALTFGLGFVVLNRRKSQALAIADAPSGQPAPASDDPFVQGSKSERRLASRRQGNHIEVSITDLEGASKPIEGWVLDRSVGGLCLRAAVAVEVGSFLNVRPRNASPVIPWTQVEVKSCRRRGEDWEIGCQFVKTPPWSVLLLFG